MRKPHCMSTLTAYPKISVVTPSYNQGQFLEATITSILDQKYPNLEYIIMDGGSKDNSVEIIKKYAPYLTYWQSQKDRGQNSAITEGFKHATGEIFAYLNSDDEYLRWTFHTVAEIYNTFPEIQWLTSRTQMICNAQGQPVFTYPAVHYARTWFYRGWGTRLVNKLSGWIQQEATFWRRELWERAGGFMDESMYVAGDFELWSRFWQHANLVTTDIPLAMYRLHDTNKSYANEGEYQKVAANVLAKFPNEKRLDGRKRQLAELLLQYTGRGGHRWGSTATWVRYNQHLNEWKKYSKTVI